MERIGQLIATLFGPLADRVADRIADCLEAKLPDLSDLDDQIVAKLPDLSNLPQQISDVLTATVSSLPGSISGGIGAIVDGIFKRDR
ncbi:hypothetical protein [Mycolicibacterium fortuitum]|uniref:Uncharacterized protein n=1 Tax=Mycolicibacterium fortuitum TaxID=1766 RepID=A0AAE4VJ95_MYCFO|nr:hypothetical protein [Mycolicibacterium fortuitum]MDV7195754.1 hypothetical protein [Mycolicibacterium fortuitum]MDV7207724.1 hypothetical protein [Mycolicibacterium fortuitum]MDV7229780.1 hypothetical protein [Mycolicibacterium fortuitum]MDV7261467.1 hypothetical protein [Mycolicibacterium fortuitum]MDV7286753.1 hypothetical protein [Mycolicibacterium fortuitum]